CGGRGKGPSLPGNRGSAGLSVRRIPMNGSPFLIVTTVSGALLAGGLWTLMRNLAGAARPPLQLAAGRDVWLRTSFVVSLLVSLLGGGGVVEWWGNFDVLILGSLGCGFALALLGMSRNQATALVAAAAVGVAGGLLFVATTIEMPFAFFPTDPRRAPSA